MERQVEAQKVIGSLTRQIAEMAGKIAVLEALLDQGPEQKEAPDAVQVVE